MERGGGDGYVMKKLQSEIYGARSCGSLYEGILKTLRWFLDWRCGSIICSVKIAYEFTIGIEQTVS